MSMTIAHLRTATSAAVIALLSLVVLPLKFSNAQRSAIDTYAITNARIITVSGPIIERGTIVVRNGLIAAVGTDATAPADARGCGRGGRRRTVQQWR